MSRYNKIRKMDISNGPGVRVSIFLQGCDFHCPGCFNAETWDFGGGKEFTDETLQTLLKLAQSKTIAGLSILGGEPLHPGNLETSLAIVKAFKDAYPEKTIWMWTGYLYENLTNKQREVISHLDVLVDGQFKQELKNLSLPYCGSSNQRVIDIRKSLVNGKLCLK